MVKKILASLAPSMRAASSSSSGTELCAYVRPRKKPNGETQHGMMIESIVLVRCNVWKIEYIGMVSRADGMSMQAIMMPMGRVLAAELNFAGGVASHHRHDGADQCRHARVDQGVQHPGARSCH